MSSGLTSLIQKGEAEFVCPLHSEGPRYSSPDQYCEICAAEDQKRRQELREQKAKIQKNLEGASDQKLMRDLMASLDQTKLKSCNDGGISAKQENESLQRNVVETHSDFDYAPGNQERMPDPHMYDGTQAMHGAFPFQGIPHNGPFIPQPVVQPWMLYLEAECAKLKAKNEELSDQVTDLKVENAELKQRLFQKDELFKYEVIMIKMVCMQKLEMVKREYKLLLEKTKGVAASKNISNAGEDPDVTRVELHSPTTNTTDSNGENDERNIDIKKHGGLESPNDEAVEAAILTGDHGFSDASHSDDSDHSLEEASSVRDEPLSILGTVPIHKTTSQAPEDFESFSSFAEGLEEVSGLKLGDSYGERGHYTGMILRSTRMPHGQGTMVYSVGRQYKGEWRYGRWHGYGIAKFENGDKYLGHYNESSRHGQGRYEWASGRCYEGSFKNNKRHGHGRQVDADGMVYEGLFENGKAKRETRGLRIPQNDKKSAHA